MQMTFACNENYSVEKPFALHQNQKEGGERDTEYFSTELGIFRPFCSKTKVAELQNDI